MFVWLVSPRLGSDEEYRMYQGVTAQGCFNQDREVAEYAGYIVYCFILRMD